LLPPPPPPSLPPPPPPKPPLPPPAAAPLTNLAARFGQARAAAAARVTFGRGGRAAIRGRRLERVAARNRARVDRVVLSVLAVVGRHPQSGSTSGGVPTTVQIGACRPPHTPRPPRRRAGAVSYSRPCRRPERRTNPKFLRLLPPPRRRAGGTGVAERHLSRHRNWKRPQQSLRLNLRPFEIRNLES
jgi:hypothetical protein